MKYPVESSYVPPVIILQPVSCLARSIYPTMLSNDFGYENWVSKAIEYYADAGDTIILISSSGTSKNIINGAKKARQMSLPIISFSGFDKNNELKKLSSLSFWVNSKEYNIVEMAHHVWLVSIVDYLCEIKTNEE